ncbi:MAG: hypothetical protein JW797_14430 [Bradymonadales bacterium]|nr:hypothetical protein [Bradymonadales bacterium]
MNARYLRTLLLVVGLSTAVVTTALADPPVPVDPSITDTALLRYQFTPGTTDNYRLDMTQNMEITGLPEEAGGSGAMQMNMGFTISQEMQESTAEGNGVMRQRIQDVVATMRMGDMEIPIGDMISTQLAALVITVQMSPRGEIVHTDLTEVQDPQMQEMMSMMEGPMSQMNIVFPEEPLTIGQSWSDEFPFALQQEAVGMNITAGATYTFLGWAMVGETRCALLQTDVQISLAGNVAEMGPAATATGSGQGTGYNYFDNATGKIASSSMDMTMNMSIAAEGMNVQQAMTMHMTMNKI